MLNEPTSFINRTGHAMDFLGYRLYPERTCLTKRNRLRLRRRLQKYEQELEFGYLSESEFQERVTAVVAFVDGTAVASASGGGSLPRSTRAASKRREPRVPRRQLGERRQEAALRVPQQEAPVECDDNQGFRLAGAQAHEPERISLTRTPSGPPAVFRRRQIEVGCPVLVTALRAVNAPGSRFFGSREAAFRRGFEGQLDGPFGPGGQVADQVDPALGRQFHGDLHFRQFKSAHGLQVRQQGREVSRQFRQGLAQPVHRNLDRSQQPVRDFSGPKVASSGTSARASVGPKTTEIVFASWIIVIPPYVIPSTPRAGCTLSRPHNQKRAKSLAFGKPGATAKRQPLLETALGVRGVQHVLGLGHAADDHRQARVDDQHLEPLRRLGHDLGPG